MTQIRIVLFALVLAGCNAAGSDPTSSADPMSVDGRTFLSTDVTQDGEERPLVDGTQIRLAFSDGQLSASAGCNTIGGTYSIDGDH